MDLNLYETEKLISEYLLFHYGTEEDILPFPEGPHGALNFPVRAITEMFDLTRLPKDARGLDLGCAVGRSSFHLSAHCQQVVGIDYSHAFIRAAQTLAQNGHIDYSRVDEGALTTPMTACLPSGAHPSRVQFLQGDAMHLPSHYSDFDFVLLANVICRLPEPRRCLDRLPSLVQPGGHLVITSPYTWLDAFTPKPNWLGGFVDGDRPIVTLETLTKALEPNFELVQKKDLPMLIREHARKFQWTVAEGTCWRRKSIA